MNEFLTLINLLRADNETALLANILNSLPLTNRHKIILFNEIKNSYKASEILTLIFYKTTTKYACKTKIYLVTRIIQPRLCGGDFPKLPCNFDKSIEL